MTFKFALPVVAGLLAGAMACQNNQQDAVKNAETELFKIHDAVMPQMGDIMKLRKQINQRLAATDSAAKGQSTPSLTLRSDEDKEQARLLTRRLTEADSLMMDWMSRYNSDTLATLEPEKAIQYLDAEKQKISNVQKKITSSITDAKQFLGKQ